MSNNLLISSYVASIILKWAGDNWRFFKEITKSIYRTDAYGSVMIIEYKMLKKNTAWLSDAPVTINTLELFSWNEGIGPDKTKGGNNESG